MASRLNFSSCSLIRQTCVRAAALATKAEKGRYVYDALRE